MKRSRIGNLSGTIIVLFGIGALHAGCESNRAGNIRAKVMGDLSNALTSRTPALDRMARSCDYSVPAGAESSPLHRHPYLQQATSQSVRIVWTTDGATDAGFEDAAVIVTRPGGVAVTSAPAVRDMSAHAPDQALQWIASVNDLEADTTYCYEVLGSGGVPLRRAAFHTPPAPGSARAVSFIAIGDSGNGSADQQAIAAQLATVPFDFMVHLGDIGYESGSRDDLERFFFQPYADLLESFPVFPASGNHEYGSEDAAPFREAFVLPENGATAGASEVERWYSYDWGDVHFAVLDTERTGAAQAAWLDADLAANTLPWTIVYFHKPPFSSGEHGNDGEAQRYLVPVLAKYRVPLVLSGHDHDYERTKPMDGVTYVVSGGGGRGTRAVGRSSFTAFAEEVCHFLYVTVEPEKLTVHAIDGVGQEFDSLVVMRPLDR